MKIEISVGDVFYSRKIDKKNDQHCRSEKISFMISSFCVSLKSLPQSSFHLRAELVFFFDHSSSWCFSLSKNLVSKLGLHQFFLKRSF